MIVLPQSVVSLGEAMYQSAFLSLEFRSNSELVTSVAKHTLNKFVKNSGSTPFQIFQIFLFQIFSGKVWENRFFLHCMTLVDPYSKLLLRIF